MLILLAQLIEQGAGYVIQQRVFDSLGGEAHAVASQQAEMTKDIALGQAVIEVAIAPEYLHRAAAHVMQLVDFLVEGQDLGAGLAVADFYLAGDIIEYLFGQLVERREAAEVVANLD